MTTNAHEPDFAAEAVKNTACLRLAEYLVGCGRARRDHQWFDRFVFTHTDGRPDLASARSFAEALRASLHGCQCATRLGVRQANHQVTVRVIANYDQDAPDAVDQVLATANC